LQAFANMCKDTAYWAVCKPGFIHTGRKCCIRKTVSFRMLQSNPLTQKKPSACNNGQMVGFHI